MTHKDLAQKRHERALRRKKRRPGRRRNPDQRAQEMWALPEKSQRPPAGWVAQ